MGDLYICPNHHCISFTNDTCNHAKEHYWRGDCVLSCSGNAEGPKKFCTLSSVKHANRYLISKTTAKDTRKYMRNNNENI